jgi:hypothetical protein
MEEGEGMRGRTWLRESAGLSFMEVTTEDLLGLWWVGVGGSVAAGYAKSSLLAGWGIEGILTSGSVWFAIPISFIFIFLLLEVVRAISTLHYISHVLFYHHCVKGNLAISCLKSN